MNACVVMSRAGAAATLFALLALASSSGQARATAVYQVPGGIASDCSVDVTQSLTSWIASVPDNAVLSFGVSACYRVDGTVQVSKRAGLDLEGNGSSFRASTAPTGPRPIWQVVDSTNITLQNMTLDGHYPNGGTFNSSVQSAHGVALLGSSADLGGLTMTNLGGDCVYFGQGLTIAETRSSGTFHDSTCSGTGRNGVSVVAGDNVLVQHVSFTKIGYDVFDVEPNPGGHYGSDGATFDSDTIGTYAMNAFSVVESGPISNPSFTNNQVVGQSLKIAVSDPTGGGFRPQNVVITGNSSNTAASNPINVDNVDGLTITGNTVPMNGGALAAVTGSCSVSISGNSFPGGTSESWFEPWICSMSPSAGPVGTSVVLTGTGFTGATSVTVAGVPASFTVNSPSQITLTVPGGAGSGVALVVTKNGTATSADSFVVTSGQQTPAPQITSFTPSSGPVGTTVTVSGAGFTGASSVTLNDAVTSFTVNSDGLITLTVPTGALSGPIRVTTPVGTATSGSSYTVATAAAPPQITSFTPSSGPVGTTVTISGSGFMGTTSVTVNGAAASFTVNSPSKLTFSVPAGASSGRIRVATPGGTATSSSSFTVTNSKKLPGSKH